MNPLYAHYMNEEESMLRRIELNLERKLIRSRFDLFNLPDREFRELFRMNKELYQILKEELTPHMYPGQRRTHLSVDTRILGALRFFATGSYQKGIGGEYNIAVAQQTMSKVITEVATALEAIAVRCIQFPIDEESKQANQLEFMEKFGFPGVIGVIDGTQIAKNVQIICDSNLKILNVNANFGGATHDPFIWRSSAICRHLEDCYRRGNRRAWLIGDSGYPLQPWLMTPITHTAEDTPERRFDDALKLARNCVERCIGTLKGRFRCLLHERMLRYDPHKAGVIINACCVLHNMCIRHNVPLDDPLEEDDHVENEPIHMNDYFLENVLQEGRIQRQNIINLYFTK